MMVRGGRVQVVHKVLSAFLVILTRCIVTCLSGPWGPWLWCPLIFYLAGASLASRDTRPNHREEPKQACSIRLYSTAFGVSFLLQPPNGQRSENENSLTKPCVWHVARDLSQPLSPHTAPALRQTPRGTTAYAAQQVYRYVRRSDSSHPGVLSIQT